MQAHAAPLVEVWRGPLRESLHFGHAVICGPDGAIREAWGAPETVVFPRSSCKMIQALPMLEAGLAPGAERLALACASHLAEAPHIAGVRAWLDDLGLDDGDLRCGPEAPRIEAEREDMIRRGERPCRIHNNCSGKHTGFLALAKHMGAGPEYADPAHPVQVAVREAFEEVTGAPSPGQGIDGCSAPIFATTLHGLARAMARFADAGRAGGVRARAMDRVVAAMAAHPHLVGGTGDASSGLIAASGGRAIVKTGAEGVFVGIVPDLGVGFALKIADGATRASECAVAALLVRLGVLPAAHPAAAARLGAPILNRMGAVVGQVRPVPGLTG